MSQRPQPGPHPELFSTRQTARILGLSPTTLEKWQRERRELPFVRVSGNSVRYRRKDIDAWIAAHLIEPNGSVINF